MAQQLRVLDTLPEDPGLILSTYTVPQNHLLTVVLGSPIPSSGPQGHQACLWYTEIHADKTSFHTEVKQIKIKS